MTPSRAALVLGVVLATTALGGCGGRGGVTPHTTACRTFQLEGGSKSPAMSTDVLHYLEGDTTLGEAITAEATAIRLAAVHGGLTTDLEQADYLVFKKLVDALDTFVVQLGAAGDTDPADASFVVPVQKAIKAAEKNCA